MRRLLSLALLSTTALSGTAVAFDWEFSGSIKATTYVADSPVQGFGKFDEDVFFDPRLELSLDALFDDYWFFHATARIDRGFDIGDDPDDGDIRIDELLLRYRPLGDNRLNIQLGKQTTVFGTWAQTHDFHDDPFILPPLAYGQIIGIGVQNPGALAPAAILGREQGTRPGIFDTKKRLWGGTIWGPIYSTGLSAFGSVGDFSYGFEMKNVGLSSHPDQWDYEPGDFDSPSFAGRVAWRPNAAWTAGVSFARGPYLDPDAEQFLPPGFDRGDLAHTAIGLDLRYSAGDWIFSGEVIGSEFETLDAGDLRSLSYHVQARYKVHPGFWIAARIGQTLNNDARGPAGESVEWSPDLLRSELAAGYRITADTLVKAHYANTVSTSNLDGPGEHIFGLGISYRF